MLQTCDIKDQQSDKDTHKDNRVRYFIQIVMMLVMVFVLNGCGGGDVADDLVPPEVLSNVPVNNATAVAQSAGLSVIFSEEMDPQTINEATFLVTHATNFGDQLVKGKVSYSGLSATFSPGEIQHINNVDTFTPAQFQASTTYRAELTTVIKDAAGNALINTVSWVFTTDVDATLPQVVSVDPQDLATGVFPGVITVVFDKDIDEATLDDTSFVVKEGTTIVSGTVSYKGRQATFTPITAGDSLVPIDPATGLAQDCSISVDYSILDCTSVSPDSLTLATQYSMTLTTAVTDTSGHALANDFVWQFNTASATGVSALLETVDNTTSHLQMASNGAGDAMAVWAQGIANDTQELTNNLYLNGLWRGARTVPVRHTIMGSTESLGFAQGLEVDTSFAYLAAGTAGLEIINISDARLPVLVGSVVLPGGVATDVKVSGLDVYVVDKTGLSIVNITNRATPTLRGSVTTSGTAQGLTLSGDYAYVADGAAGLKVFRVVDNSGVSPVNIPVPVLVATLDTPGDAQDIDVAGGFVYVADGASGLQVIDVSDPLNPVLTGSFDTVGIAYDVVVDATTAYIADGSAGLVVIDVSTAATPQLLGSVDTNGSAWGVTVDNGYVYISDDSVGLQLVDANDPVNPVLEWSVDTPGNARSLVKSGNQIYIADGNSGLQLLDALSNATTDHQIAVDDSGNITVVWRQFDGVRWDIVANRYLAGQGWGVAKQLDTIDSGDAFSPQVTTDKNDNAIVVWSQNDGVRDNIYSRFFEAGVGWNAPVLIEVLDIGDARSPQVATYGNGNAVAVWQQFDGTYNSIYANRRFAGQGWSTVQLIETDTGNEENALLPLVVADNNGDGAVIWYQYDGSFFSIYSSLMTSSGWAVETIIDSATVGNAVNPSVAMDSLGAVLVAWQQSDGDHTNIFSARLDAGVWATPILLDQDDAGDAINPQVAIDVAGNAAVVWEQNDGVRWNIWANRYDSVNAWGTALLLDDDDAVDNAGNFLTRDSKNSPRDARHPRLAALRQGAFSATWLHHDGSRQNVWSNQFTVP